MKRFGLVILALLAALPAQAGPKLYLRNGTFEPGNAQFLAIPGRGAVPSKYRIVQFRGPVQEAWKQAAVRAGAQLLEYLPDYAFLATLKPGAEDALRQLPFVNWVGSYTPEMKVDPALARRRGLTTAVAQLFPGESDRPLVDAARALAIEAIPREGHVLLVGDAAAIRSLASQPGLYWLAPAPRIRITVDRARPVIGATTVWQDLGLYGEGQIVAIMDTGLDTGTPRTLLADFQNKVVAAMGHNTDNDWADRVGHGTHVAGIIAGTGELSGSDPLIPRFTNRSFAGVAPLAKLVVQEIDVEICATGDKPANFDSTTDLTQFLRFGYENGARIHNNSWGDDDVELGAYTLHAQQVDRFIFEHPNYTAVFAAGNNGQDGVSQKELAEVIGELGLDPCSMTDPSEIYEKLLEDLFGGGGFDPFDPFGDEDPFGGFGGGIFEVFQKLEEMQSRADGIIEGGNLMPPGTAKNVITVGASEGDRPPGKGYGGIANSTWDVAGFFADPIASDPTSDNPGGMAPFSSRGPTLDGRIKPDIVAPGTNIISLRSKLAPPPGDTALSGGNPVYWGKHDDNHAYAGGTSQATPFVSGAAALVREYYQKRRGISEPSAALIKATLLNTATDLSPGQYGTGEFREMEDRPNPVEGWGRLNLQAALKPSEPLQLAFEEPSPGLQTGESRASTFTVAQAGHPLRFTLVWTDPPGSPAAQKALVNDLDLVVTTPDGQTLLGNGAEDRLNNVEGVDIAAAAAGEYRVEVRAANVPQGPQSYALVVSGALDAVTAPVVYGDLSGDGQLTIADALAALRVAAGLAPPPTGDLLALADVAPKPGTEGRPFGDGRVDVQDVLRLLKQITGLETGVWP